jgi:hypothetical protein
MSNHNFNIVNSIASKSAKNLLLNFPGCSPVNNIKPSKKEKKNFKTINNFYEDKKNSNDIIKKRNNAIAR